MRKAFILAGVMTALSAGAFAQQTAPQEPASPPAVQNPAPSPAPAAPAAPDRSAADLAFWSAIKDSKNPDEFKAYLDAFPNGTFAVLAKLRMEQAAKAAAAPPPAAPAPVATPVPARPATPATPAGSALADTGDIATMREMQFRLYNLNYGVQRQDGIVDPSTQKAIREWQEKVNLPVTGMLTNDQVERLKRVTLPKTWSSLAYTARGVTGIVYNRPTRNDAVLMALEACRKKAGRKADCEGLTGFDSTCTALAAYRQTSGGRIYYGANAALRPNLADSISAALAACNDNPRSKGTCALKTTVCADGSHRK